MLGAALLPIGAILFVGGIVLFSVGGSWYYAIAGALLVWSSLLIIAYALPAGAH